MTTTAPVHAQEGQHWYTRDGSPSYLIKGAKGQDRAPTLRDARALLLVPGVSSIIKMAAAPGLQIYRERQVLLAALTLPRKDGQSEEEWIKAVYEDSREHAKQAALKGTAIHAALEQHYAEPHKYIEHPYTVEVHAVVDLLSVKFPDAKWVAERTFASGLGYGGKIDLCSWDGSIILDFKTKEFGADFNPKQMAWDEQAMQLAAYSAGISTYQQTICGNVFVSTSVPGLVHLHLWSEEELGRAERMFFSLLSYWTAKTGYETVFGTKDEQATEAALRG